MGDQSRLYRLFQNRECPVVAAYTSVVDRMNQPTDALADQFKRPFREVAL